MVKRVLTQAAAGEIRRMRAELNEWDEPRWTGADIADALGVSESTVWRVLRRVDSYAKGKVIPSGGLSMESAGKAMDRSPPLGLDEEAKTSERRFLRLLQKGPETPSTRLPDPLNELSPEAAERLKQFKDE